MVELEAQRVRTHAERVEADAGDVEREEIPLDCAVAALDLVDQVALGQGRDECGHQRVVAGIRLRVIGRTPRLRLGALPAHVRAGHPVVREEQETRLAGADRACVWPLREASDRDRERGVDLGGDEVGQHSSVARDEQPRAAMITAERVRPLAEVDRGAAVGAVGANREPRRYAHACSKPGRMRSAMVCALRAKAAASP